MDAKRINIKRAFTNGVQPGLAQTGYMGTSPSGPTTRGGSQRGPVSYGSGGPRRGPWRSDPQLRKLALGTWNVTSLAGKELELVEEVERFRLDIVGLTSTHSSALEPKSFRGVEPSSLLELLRVRGGGLGWAFS